MDQELKRDRRCGIKTWEEISLSSSESLRSLGTVIRERNLSTCFA